MYDITSIADLVDELGGPTALGAKLGISSEAISNWIAREAIATGWHVRLWAMVSRRGLTVDPAVFNYTEEEVEGLIPKRPLARRRAESLRA